MSGTSQTVVVDGATGFVGSNFVYDQLCRGARVVVFVRGEAGRATELIRGAVAGTSDDVGPPMENLEVVTFDLERPGLGLSDAVAERLLASDITYWHFAASLKFLPGNYDELMRVNRDGTMHTLDWFRGATPASRYYLVSTSYVCGLMKGTIGETWHPPAPPSEFRNYYEYSKRASENALRPAIEAGEVRGGVVRLGAIVGDSRTGASNSRFGFYEFIERLFRLAVRRPGTSLRIVGHRDAAQSLLPVDVCATWLDEIRRSDLGGEAPIGHVVDPRRIRIDGLLELLEQYLPVSLSLIDEEEAEVTPLTPLENLLRAGMAFTGKYLDEPVRFDQANLESATGARAPVVDDEMLDRFVRTFVEDLERERGDAPVMARRSQ